MSVYKDSSKPENLRIDAAKAAIRYERPALAPVERRDPESDYVPLLERLNAYEREDLLKESAMPVVSGIERGVPGEVQDRLPRYL